MNFLACDGTWSVGVANQISCSGSLITVTGQELATELKGPSLTPEDSALLFESTLMLFITVFGFLVLKKML